MTGRNSFQILYKVEHFESEKPDESKNKHTQKHSISQMTKLQNLAVHFNSL
uniref:Uncharacterized protein n=1 Tax=Anguilla anguilla TaxID=7936 RepID=A0A0E9XJZ9_ANGAN